MSLFDAAVDQVMKDVGGETVIAVSSRNMADYCQMFALIERKPKSWHWPWTSKFDYVPTEIFINDILEEAVDTKNAKITSTVLFEKYDSSPSFKRNGEIGGKLATEFNIEASASKILQVELKLGNVSKKEILWEKLYELLNDKKFKADHPLVQLINRNRKRKLFVVAAVVTSGEEELSKSEETKENVDGGATVAPSVALNLDASASADNKHHTEYDIPAGTCLGYSCNEITFGKNGNITLLLDEDVRN